MVPTGEGAGQPPSLPCSVQPAAPLGCDSWDLPGAWIPGALPGDGAVGKEHHPGALGRQLPPKANVEHQKGHGFGKE